MHRFRVDLLSNSQTILISDAGQLHHLKDVLRLSTGDEITLFDGSGCECFCEISRFNEQGVTLNVKSRKQNDRPKFMLTVACAVPKKGMDEIIDKLTQLGVDTVVPMLTERVVMRSNGERDMARLERWRRLARVASEQSQRSHVPEVQALTSFETVLANSNKFDLKLIPNLNGKRKNLHDVVTGSSNNILVLVGPEGDFTPGEVESAVQTGFVPISLGSLVLRVDTAAIAAAACIMMLVGK
jgi:16S rRNA (uracil1498-N3)-methyltransferase